MSNDINSRLYRLERAHQSLQSRQKSHPTLVYADGSQQTMGVLAAIDEIGKRDDIVDILSEDETTRTLFLGLLGPWDFSDLPELADDYQA